MYKHFYQGMELVQLPLFALLFFALVFVLVISRLIARGGRAYELAARLPLEQDEARRSTEEIGR